MMSVFKNNDSFKLITIVDDMDLPAFQKQYGDSVLPIIGVSKTNKLLPAKSVELFNKDDRWIILDKKLK